MTLKLLSVTINNFRHIRNLTIPINNQEICIVGKNESGKSSILQAIAFLDKDTPYAMNDLDIPEGDDIKEYIAREKEIITLKIAIPISDLKEYLVSTIDSTEVQITILDGKEEKEMKITCSTSSHQNQNSTSSNTSDPTSQQSSTNGWPYCLLNQLPQGKIVVHLKKYYHQQPQAPKSPTQPNRTEDQQKNKELKVYSVMPSFISLEKIVEKLPHFIYFNVFDEYITDMVEWTKLNQTNGWKNVARLLGINAKEHTKINTLFQQGRINELKKIENTLSRKLTSHFEGFWTGTTKHIDVALNSGKIGINCVETNNGTIVRQLVPSQMSAGYKWAFSFYIKVNALLSNENKRPIVFLFDEPSTTLAPEQQRKLLKQFKILSSNTNYVIWTTHSPFMIPVTQTTYIVEKTPEGNVSLSRPLEKSVRLDLIRRAIDLQLADLFIYGPYVLLVEGQTDKHHLSLHFSKALLDVLNIYALDGVHHLDRVIKRLIQENIHTIAHIAVLVDNDESGINELKKIPKGSPVQKIVLPEEDIEDLYHYEDYSRILKKILDVLCKQGTQSDKKINTKKIMKELNIDPPLFKFLFARFASSLDFYHEETTKRFQELEKKICDALQVPMTPND